LRMSKFHRSWDPECNCINCDKKEDSSYPVGHFHYRGCKNDTSASKDNKDCDCQKKKDFHLLALKRASLQNQPGVMLEEPSEAVVDENFY